MASRDFLSTSDQSFTTTGNWTASTVPVAGDAVTFTLSSAVSIDGSDQNTINLASIGVGPSYTGDIGSSGSYLIISADYVSIVGGTGMGNIYLDSGATDEFDEVVIDSASTSNRVYLDGDIGTLIVRHGKVTLVGGTCDNVYIEWNGSGNYPEVVNEGSTITSFRSETLFSGSQTGGTITTYRASQGSFVVDAGTVANYDLAGNAAVEHNTDETVTLVDIWSGASFDASNDVRAKTFSAVNLHQGGVADFDNGLPGSMTLTAKKEFGSSAILEAN
ncbi:MAG: hypothetical protein DHS20C16_03610 [Phycisphaerae bacterium]|nr:MAG: hypothetical protein DHS20C16_03610 [Phycisphaerae bacterium]